MAGSALDVAFAVSRSMNAAATAMELATKRAMAETAKRARSTMVRQSKPVPGSDSRFSGMANYNHGGRLSVKVRQRAGEVWVMSKGPWKLAESGADPHRIGGWQHPGTRSSQGRRSWTIGEEETIGDAERDVPRVIGDAVERAFGSG